MKPVFTTCASFGFPPRRRDLHAALWNAAAAPAFARRRIYDLRIALCLQAFGVTDFATSNVKHFEDTGFSSGEPV